MRRKIYMWFAVALLLLLGVFTAWQAREEKIYKIQNTTKVLYENGRMYGIDFTGESYNVFSAEMDGNGKLVSVPATGRQGKTGLWDITVSDKGQVYVYGTFESRGVQKAAVYQVDFENRRLKREWILSESIRQNFLALSMLEGHRPMVIVDYGILMRCYQLIEGGKLEVWNSFILPNASLFLDASDSEHLWFYDAFGNVYNYDSNGGLQCLFANDRSQVGVDNTDFQLDGNVLRFYNITENSWYGIDFDNTGGEIEKLGIRNKVISKTFDQKRIGELLYIKDEDVYLGILPLEDLRQVPAVFGSMERVYDTLTLDEKVVWDNFVKAYGMRAAALTLFLVIFWYLVIGRKRFPLWERVVWIVIPVIALGYWWISAQVDHQMESITMESHLELMYSYGQIQIQNLDKERFCKMREAEFLEPGDEKELFQSGPHRLTGYRYKRDDSEGRPNETFIVNLYYVKGDGIYSAAGNNVYNIPADQFVPARIYEAMETAVDRREPSYLEYNDSAGRWYSVFVPIEDQDELIGLLQVQSPMEQEVAEGMAASREIHRSVLLLSGGIVLVVIVILLANMQYLEVLFRAVEKVAKGDRSVRVKVRGRSEAAVTGEAFNRMMEELDDNLRGLEAFNEKYRAFVPNRLCRLMGHETVDDMELGEEKEIDASVLSVGHSQLTRNYLEEFLAIIREHGGVAGHISEMEMDNIFAKSPQYALKAAVSILQKEKDSELSMGLAYGSIRLGIIGGESRKEVKMISSSLQFSRFLRQRAKTYGASLLISDIFMMQLGADRERYHQRLLGFILVKSTGKLEPVWEILDGELQESFLLKEQTKVLFEKGVELFMVGEFAAARRKFIQVLDKNRQDVAASRYSFLCQRYMEQKKAGGQTQDIYLEAF